MLDIFFCEGLTSKKTTDREPLLIRDPSKASFESDGYEVTWQKFLVVKRSATLP